MLNKVYTQVKTLILRFLCVFSVRWRYKMELQPGTSLLKTKVRFLMCALPGVQKVPQLKKILQ